MKQTFKIWNGILLTCQEPAHPKSIGLTVILFVLLFYEVFSCISLQVVRHYHGHLSAIYSLDLHPTIDVLFTCGRDATTRVKIYYIITTAQEVVKNCIMSQKCFVFLWHASTNDRLQIHEMFFTSSTGLGHENESLYSHINWTYKHSSSCKITGCRTTGNVVSIYKENLSWSCGRCCWVE